MREYIAAWGCLIISSIYNVAGNESFTWFFLILAAANFIADLFYDKKA